MSQEQANDIVRRINELLALHGLEIVIAVRRDGMAIVAAHDHPPLEIADALRACAVHVETHGLRDAWKSPNPEPPL